MKGPLARRRRSATIRTTSSAFVTGIAVDRDDGVGADRERLPLEDRLARYRPAARRGGGAPASRLDQRAVLDGVAELSAIEGVKSSVVIPTYA